jgi:predicted outer membrane protein
MTTMKLLTAAAALLSLAACQSPTARSTGGTATPTELGFVTNAYQIIRFDREEGALAETEARDPRVKALAARLVAEANQFATQLDPVAASAGITPPAELNNDLRVRLGHMRLEQGLDFDRTYLTNQIASHESALHELDTMKADPSPRFADLAQRAEVLLKTNLQALRVLRDALNKPAS